MVMRSQGWESTNGHAQSRLGINKQSPAVMAGNQRVVMRSKGWKPTSGHTKSGQVLSAVLHGNNIPAFDLASCHFLLRSAAL